MKTATFSCPHCLSPLRIRDRAFVNREIGCPECGERIEIQLDRDQEPIARKAAAPDEAAASESEIQKRRLPPKTNLKRKLKSKSKDAKQKNGKAPKEAAKSPPRFGRKPLIELGERFSGVPEVLLSPVGIAWSVAGLVAVTLLVVAWPGGDSVQSKTSTDQIANSETPQAEDSAEKSALGSEDIPLPDVPAGSVPPEGDIAAQLRQLGASIDHYVQRREHFPVGTVGLGNQPVKDRFSWLADLLVQTSQKPIAEPQWDQPWNDPLNDRFVRRQLAPFLNPNIRRRVGADRYPTTHFAGIAGVGADAPSLPVNHPRAGIFGQDRITRPEDITDGAANTMMVAGVNEQLGSWAAAGRSTMRPFTREPYINGPDGFGTGEAGGMSVLMADGSVRFVSRQTSPQIIRRMAAMADGLPLDEKVPGEPGEKPLPKPEPKQRSPEPPLPPVAAQNPNPLSPDTDQTPNPNQSAADPPKPAEVVPEKPVDIAAALAVKIVKFEQLKDVPFKELIFQVEEMCGVPIKRGDDVPTPSAEVWNTPVSLRLQDTTVRKILEALLEKISLSYTIEKDHIRLHKPQ